MFLCYHPERLQNLMHSRQSTLSFAHHDYDSPYGKNTLNYPPFLVYYSWNYTFLEQFLRHSTHYYGKICNFALCMKHRRLDKYVTLYNVCKRVERLSIIM